MSTISKNRSSSQTRQSSSAKSTKPAQKPQQSNRPQRQSETRKPGDNFRASDETREGRGTRESRRNRETDRNRDRNRPEDVKDNKENKETKGLEDKLSDLEKQLQELKDDKKTEAPPAPQQSGGCCGGGDKGGGEKGGCGDKQANPMNNAQGINGQNQGGPDGELQALASQVLQASGGMGGNPQMGGMPQAGGVPGMSPMGGRPGGNPFQAGFQAGMQGGSPMGGGNPQAQMAKSQLAQKASQYAQQGFQPQPATRVLVQSALGYDAFQQQGMQQQNPFGMQGFGQNQGFPNLGVTPLPNLGATRF